MAERPSVVCSAEPPRAAGRLLAQALVAAEGARGVARTAIPGGSALSMGPARALAGVAWRRMRPSSVGERMLRGDRSLPAHGLPGLVVVTDLDLDGSR